MSPDRGQELIAQQRTIKQHNPPKCPPGLIGDVVVCALSSAVISACIVHMLIEWWLS